MAMRSGYTYTVVVVVGLLLATAAAQISDLHVTDLVKTKDKGGGGSNASSIIWSPSIVVTKRNVTLANADAQWKDSQGHLTDAKAVFSRSMDGGRTFGPNQALPGGMQMLYSPLTDTLHGFGVGVPNASDSALTWATSTDDGATWSDPVVLQDPFILGEGGLGHGIELQNGPHRGRFVLPYAENSMSRDKYAAHALAVFSDNHGLNWTAGALLPDYSGEASLTELGNGSVLISFRMEGEHMPHNPKIRGFARSDDGCATWAEIWYLDDRQPEIIDAPSMQAIDRSTKTGLLYFGHPGAVDGDRANYTIHRSSNEGATWDYMGVIFPNGSGYSDVHVLPHDGPGDRLGVAFQRTLYEPGVEGGGYNMAWASMTIV